MGFPFADDLLDCRRVRQSSEVRAHVLVAEHLRQLRENLQMEVGCLFRHQQHEYKVHRIAVRRFEGDRIAGADKRAGGIAQALDATVRNGDAMPQPGRSQAFAREQRFEYLAAADTERVFEQQTDVFEHQFLAGHVEVERDVGYRQQPGDQTHGGLGDVLPLHRRQVAEGFFLVVIDALLLVFEDLAVELVGQAVDGSVHVRVNAFDVDILAANVHVCLDLVVQFVDGQDDIDVYDVVEVAGDAVDFIDDVGPDGGGDFQMMAG